MKTQTNKNQYKIPGGTTGQALVKQSNTDYDFDWGTVSGGGGGTKLAIDTTQVATGGSGVETTFYTIPIPANTLGTNDAIRFAMILSDLGIATGDDVIFRVKYGATTLCTITLDEDAINQACTLYGYIVADNATNAQKGFAHISTAGNNDVNPGNIGDSYGTAIEDSTTPLNLVITVEQNNGGNAQAEAIIVEKITDGGGISGGAVTITGMVAGEQIQGATSTPQACFIGDNTESDVTGTTTPQTQSPGQDVNFKTQKVARLITVTERQSVNLVEFVALKSGTPSATYKVSIQGDNAGEPDGVEATSVTANTSAFSSSASGAVVNLAFSQTAELDSGTDYWVVFETTVTDTGDWYLKYAGSADGGEETYMVYSGGVWSAGTASQWLQIQLQVKYTQALVWRSDNNVTNRQKFDMIVPADYALGATITSAVRMGEQDDFVGMTAGAEQYLSDTRGAVSGSGTVVVGRAVSTTKLLVDRYNGLV